MKWRGREQSKNVEDRRPPKKLRPNRDIYRSLNKVDNYKSTTGRQVRKYSK